MLTICIVVMTSVTYVKSNRDSVPVKIWDISSPKSTSCACSRLVLSSLYTFAHVNRFHKHLNNPGGRGWVISINSRLLLVFSKTRDFVGDDFQWSNNPHFLPEKNLFLFILHLELISNKKNVSFHIFTFLFH